LITKRLLFHLPLLPLSLLLACDVIQLHLKTGILEERRRRERGSERGREAGREGGGRGEGGTERGRRGTVGERWVSLHLHGVKEDCTFPNFSCRVFIWASRRATLSLSGSIFSCTSSC